MEVIFSGTFFPISYYTLGVVLSMAICNMLYAMFILIIRVSKPPGIDLNAKYQKEVNKDGVDSPRPPVLRTTTGGGAVAQSNFSKVQTFASDDIPTFDDGSTYGGAKLASPLSQAGGTPKVTSMAKSSLPPGSRSAMKISASSTRGMKLARRKNTQLKSSRSRSKLKSGVVKKKGSPKKKMGRSGSSGSMKAKAKLRKHSLKAAYELVNQP